MWNEFLVSYKHCSKGLVFWFISSRLADFFKVLCLEEIFITFDKNSVILFL